MKVNLYGTHRRRHYFLHVLCRAAAGRQVGVRIGDTARYCKGDGKQRNINLLLHVYNASSAVV